MLQAGSERPAAGAAAAAASMWVPGMSPQAVDYAGSARAREITRRREEMLGMLHDLPESEYELSLTDLVEKSGAPPLPLPETKQASPLGPGRSASGSQAEQQQQTAAAARPERKGSASGSQAEQQQQQAVAAARPERKGSARQRGSNFRSSSDGVLLNFYMPRSISRSFTAPRPGRTPSISGGRTASIPDDDCNKRERDGGDTVVKCWPLPPWDRRWRKSSRRDPPGELAARAAILKAAEHSAAPPANV